MTTTDTTAGAAFLRLETRPLGDLTPYPGNARRGDVGMILESLTANGQFRPLVAREEEDGRLVVLAGNHTMAALAAHGSGPCGLVTRHGDEERPCAVCHGKPWEPAAQVAVYRCDDATARRIVLADNRTSDAGDYDDQALADLLAGLDGDLVGTGYTDTDLADLLEYLETEAADDPYEEGQDEEAGEETPAGGQAAPPAPAPAGEPAPSSTPAGGDTPPPPAAPGHAHLTLTYPVADRDETARLIAAVRDVLPDLESAEVVLRALRALVAVIDSRHDPDGVVRVASLLRAAGVPA